MNRRKRGTRRLVPEGVMFVVWARDALPVRASSVTDALHFVKTALQRGNTPVTVERQEVA